MFSLKKINLFYCFCASRIVAPFSISEKINWSFKNFPIRVNIPYRIIPRVVVQIAIDVIEHAAFSPIISRKNELST